MSRLAVAALSARLLAEVAAQDGFSVVALDSFGDADTRACAAAWHPIGTADPLVIDGEALLQALSRLAAEDQVLGWVAGSPLDGQTELLTQASRILPLIGASPAAMQQLRDPRAFFGCLATHGLPFPETRWSPPASPAGWLFKQNGSTGGWGVRPLSSAGQAAAMAACEGGYWQRQIAGRAMSATLIADGTKAQVLGFNESLFEALGDRPFVFAGIAGPVPVSAGVAALIAQAAHALTRRSGFRGLGSLDFMLDETGQPHILELNPRPPASLALYRHRVPGGAMAAHVRACLQAQLPAPGSPASAEAVSGWRIVRASCDFELVERAAAQLSRWPACHDRPAAGTAFKAGDPVCSLSATGRSLDEVRRGLHALQERWLDKVGLLETHP